MKKIGFSLLPYQSTVYSSIIKALQDMSVDIFEFPYFEIDRIDSTIKNIKPHSVHALKSLLFLEDDIFICEVYKLRAFCEKISCSKIVVHPNNNYYKNIKCFEIIKKLLPEYSICVENTILDMNSITKLVDEYDFSYVWDCAHAVFYKHKISTYLERINYFHVRGYSRQQRYTSLANSEKIKYPDIDDKVYMLEYPYNNIHDILVDIKKMKSVIKE